MRITIEVLLASFACWLVVQNALLLALDPWALRPAVWAAIAAIFKAAGLVLALVWPWLALGAIGLAAAVAVLAARLTARGERGAA